MSKSETESNLLKDRYPEIFEMVYPDMNDNVDSLTYGSKRDIWFICVNFHDHVFQSNPRAMVKRKNKCPLCTKDNKDREMVDREKLTEKKGTRKNLPRERSFMNNPELEAMFFKDLNPGIDPWQISYGSSKKIIWTCINPNACCKHSWPAIVSNVAIQGKRCPYCAGRTACGCRNLTHHPRIYAEFKEAGDRNKGIEAKNLLPGSSHYAWFKCLDHDTCELHIWWCRISHRTGSGSGCPVCESYEKACPCISFMRNDQLSKEVIIDEPDSDDEQYNGEYCFEVKLHPDGSVIQSRKNLNRISNRNGRRLRWR